MAFESKSIQEEIKANKDQVQNQIKQPSSIVVGMGPAGLSAAFFLLLEGHKVTLIDNRDDYTRNQRVILNEIIINQLFGLSNLPKMGYQLKFNPDLSLSFEIFCERELELKDLSIEQRLDYDFFSELSSSNCAIPLKTLQNYQFTKLIEFSKKTRINYTNIERKNLLALLKNLDEESSPTILEETKNAFIKILEVSTKEFENDLKRLKEDTEAFLTKMISELKSHYINETSVLRVLPEQTQEKIKSLAPEQVKEWFNEFIKKQEELLMLNYELKAIKDEPILLALIGPEIQNKLEALQTRQPLLESEITKIENDIKQEIDKPYSEVKPSDYNSVLKQGMRTLYEGLKHFYLNFATSHVQSSLVLANQIYNLQSSCFAKLTALELNQSQIETQLQTLNQNADLNTEVLDFEVDFEVRGSLTILRGSHYEITELNGNNQVLRLHDKSQNKTIDYPFDYFVSAEGSKHEMATLLAKSNPEQFSINYTLLPQPRQENHAVIILKLSDTLDLSQIDSRIIGVSFPGSSKMNKTDLKSFKELGWNKSYLPLTFLDFNKKTKECYCVCEIPEIFVSDPKTESEYLQLWGELIAKIEFGFEKSQIEKIKEAVPFKIAPKCADRNCVELGKKGVFFIVGDAFLSANVLFGHGVYNAIMDSQALFECFENGSLESLIPFKERFCASQKDYKSLSESFTLLLNNGSEEMSLASNDKLSPLNTTPYYNQTLQNAEANHQTNKQENQQANQEFNPQKRETTQTNLNPL